MSKNGGTETPCPVTLKSDHSDFDITHSVGTFIAKTDVDKLSNTEAAALSGSPQPGDVPSDPWVLYLKTDVPVGGVTAKYGIRLFDGKLYSARTEQSVGKRTLPAPKVFAHTDMDNTAVSGVYTEKGATNASGNEDLNATNSAAHSGSEADPIPVYSAYGSAVKLTIKKTDGTDYPAGVILSQGVQLVLGSGLNGSIDVTPDFIKLPSPKDGGGEAVYKVTVKATGEGFDDSTTRTLYYKVCREVKTVTSTLPMWHILKEAIAHTSAGGTVVVNGEIKATNYGTAGVDANWGEIQISKNLTIKKAGSASSAVIDANKNNLSNANTSRIFLVNSGTLMLENLTLKGGMRPTGGDGGGIFVNTGAGAFLIDCRITDCVTNLANGGAVYTKGTLSLTRGSIGGTGAQEGNKAKYGGGIYVAGGSCTLTGTVIKENYAGGGIGTGEGKGGGIYIEKGTCELDGVTLQSNTVKNGSPNKGKGSAVYLAKTASDTPTLTLKGNVQIGDSTPNSNTICLGYAVNGSIIQTAFVSATSADLNASTHINIEPENYEKQSNLDLVKGTDIRWKETSFHLTNIPTSEGNWNLTNMVDSIPNVNRLALRRTTAVLSAPYTGSWKALKEAIQSVSSGGTLKLSGTFKATSGDDSGEILLRKTLTIEGNSSAVIDADNKCRIFNLQGILTLKDVTLERGDATSSDDTNGGAVYVSNVGELKIEGSTFIVPPATAAAGKNDVYLKGDRKISVDGALTGGYPVARITPENYSGGTQVLYGDITSGTPQNNTKFAVTPENDGTVWCVGADGKLALVQTETLTAANETQLENNILNAVIGKPRIITITADISSSSIFEIQNGRDITIKADGTQKTLTCELPPINKNVFHIKSGGKLTLEGNIKLQGTNYGSRERFGIYVEQGGIAEIKDNVVITGFQKTGSACVYTNGTLIMSGGKITGNQADNGGGVFIFNNGTFTMTGGTITGNHANTNGKAMWIRGIFNWLGGTITGNTGTGDVLHIKLNGKINNPYGFEAS
ncbi:hypothetical protein [Treponema socranskii]|uniref:hypothetical protein n=1 Tax=Treponema socranskii TaxID=53419 RepID=UPI0023F03727|nr:hypothetical protein [Treponema socranskii]